MLHKRKRGKAIELKDLSSKFNSYLAKALQRLGLGRQSQQEHPSTGLSVTVECLLRWSGRWAFYLGEAESPWHSWCSECRRDFLSAAVGPPREFPWQDLLCCCLYIFLPYNLIKERKPPKYAFEKHQSLSFIRNY